MDPIGSSNLQDDRPRNDEAWEEKNAAKPRLSSLVCRLAEPFSYLISVESDGNPDFELALLAWREAPKILDML